MDDQKRNKGSPEKTCEDEIREAFKLKEEVQVDEMTYIDDQSITPSMLLQKIEEEMGTQNYKDLKENGEKNGFYNAQLAALMPRTSLDLDDINNLTSS